MIRRKVPGLRDPFAAFAAIRRQFPRAFILESLTGPERLREHTFLGFGPQVVVSYASGVLRENGDARRTDAPLDAMRGLLDGHAEHRQEVFTGGLVGYVSYDFVRNLERVPARPSPPFPEFEFGLYQDGIVVDHRRGNAFYFSHGEDRLSGIDLSPATADDFDVGTLRLDGSPDAFLASVRRARGAIHDGEVFQVVLSRKLEGRFSGDLLAVYEALRRINPSPYMYFLDFGDRQIVGSSPEMLLRVRGRAAITYPIAGTRPLGATPDESSTLRAELLGDEKERAEHAMLVDLARNDLGKVCAFGTVRVPEYMTAEAYSHVQHLVSRVEGTLRPERDALDAFAAMFPAGTVSGAPKPRAMELIDKLEVSPRGPYAGAVGYASCNGNLDSAITIRTLVAHGDRLELRAGAGIVADSDPQREWRETEHKLGALRAALGEAVL